MKSFEENTAKMGIVLSFSALEDCLKRYDQAAEKQMSNLIKAGLETANRFKSTNERQQWTSSLMENPRATTNDPNDNFTVTPQEVASLFYGAREKRKIRSIGNADIQSIETVSTKTSQAGQKRKHDTLEDNYSSNFRGPSSVLAAHNNKTCQDNKEGQQWWSNGVSKPFEVAKSVTKQGWTPKQAGSSTDQFVDLNRTNLWKSHDKINSNSNEANDSRMMPAPRPGEKACPRQEIVQKPRINVPTFQQRPSVDSIGARVLRGPSSGPQNIPHIEPSVSRQSSENQETTRRPFRTARDELVTQNIKRFGQVQGPPQVGAPKRSLGTRKAAPPGKFVPPYKVAQSEPMEVIDEEAEPQDERLRNIDPLMVEMICNEIMDVGSPVEWDDIAGLEFAKKTIQEIVVWPLLRPDIFCGLRRPPKGILLFGPPGTGKTLIGKCIASQSKSTFFSISASSLTSKWVGDGEKMVRALFAVARCHQPAVIFIDEIDSLLSQRCEAEHESSRRIKTEFLVQLDGACTAEEERILVVGATNRPQELDEAARRRLVKRLYVPLPETNARAQMVRHLMASQRCRLTEADIQQVAALAHGFSGADMRDLCREASYGPIRAIDLTNMEHILADQVRPVTLEDFQVALQQVRPSVSCKDLSSYEDWNKTYGYGS